MHSDSLLKYSSKSVLGGHFGSEKKCLAPPPKKNPQFAADTLSAPRPLSLLETPLLGFSIKNRPPPPSWRLGKKPYPKRPPRAQSVVIHYIFSSESLRVANSLQIGNSLRILFLVCRGPLGCTGKQTQIPPFPLLGVQKLTQSGLNGVSERDF